MRTVLTSQQMAEADAHTINDLGVPGIELMERAAMACCDAVTQMVDSTVAVAVLVGCGNNGGDGLAIARLLLERNYQVHTFLAMPDKPFKGDAATNYQRLKEMGASIEPLSSKSLAIGRFGLLVDALFGTGLDRPLQGELRELVSRVNALHVPVLAVDIPSGLSGSSGKLMGEAIRATRTVTFQFPKLAHVVTPACGYCGILDVADIGIRRIPGAKYTFHALAADDYKRQPRERVSHKGSFGTLAIFGGFSGMEGAANLAAVSSLRFGVGKVRVYTNNRNRFHHDSVMVENISHYQPQYNALILGPGMGRSEEAFVHIKRLNLEKERVLWDADSIYFLKRYLPTCLGSEWVMTPHPGEAATLLGCLAREIQQDRLVAIEALSEKFPGGWIVLKGYRTLVRSPDGNTWVCTTGNPALAVAGSGDVLSGMIGAMMAQGYPMRDAVLMGVLRHGIAGDRWSQHHPDYSMLAEDIIADLCRKL